MTWGHYRDALNTEKRSEKKKNDPEDHYIKDPPLLLYYDFFSIKNIRTLLYNRMYSKLIQSVK